MQSIVLSTQKGYLWSIVYCCFKKRTQTPPGKTFWRHKRPPTKTHIELLGAKLKMKLTYNEQHGDTILSFITLHGFDNTRYWPHEGKK